MRGKLFYILALWLTFIAPLYTYGLGKGNALYRPGLFTSIKDTSLTRRVEGARAIYRVKCRGMAEDDAMKSLNDLKKLAIELKDLPLECAVYDMRADYYSVNHGYNKLSTNYYEQAIAFAKEAEMPLEEGIYQHRKANYYFLYKQNTTACRYYLLAEQTLRKVGFDNVPDMGTLFSETANFYYALGDFDNARENLRYALKYQPKISRTRINIINTIGLTYRNLGQYKTAMSYFINALNMAQSTKDKVWIAICKGNIGSVFFLKHQYIKALPLIQEDYDQSVKFDQKINAAIALLRLIRINFDYGRFQIAGMQLDTADVLLNNTGEDVLTQRVDYYELRSLFSERLNKINEAALYRDKSEDLRDSVAKRDNIAAIERVRLQWVMEKSHQEFTNLKKSADVTAFKQNTIIVVLVLLIIISFLIYNSQRLKAKKDKELLSSEKLRVDEELKNATLALHGYTESLMQKNILIDEIKTELESVKLKFDNADIAASLDKMMQAHIMTDGNWVEFKKLFSRVYGTFFYNLRHRYANISDTDTRLLALIKLKLNNREMAGMLGITIDGIKKAKQRLRKKMNIPDSEEIEEVLNTL